MNSPQYSTNQHAVTLVELLAGVGILVILATLLFPALLGMIDRAMNATCMANMRSVGNILLAAHADNDGYFPVRFKGQRVKLIDPVTKSNSSPHSDADVTRALREDGYISKQYDALYCPAMRVSKKGLDNLKAKKQTPIQHLKETGSYCINTYLLQVKSAGIPGKFSSYAGDSRMLFIAENYCGIGGRWEGMIWTPSQLEWALDGADFGASINVKGHHHGNNKLNFMFLDGHIVPLAPKVKEDGSYDWNGVFDKTGSGGKYIGPRTYSE